MKKKFNVNGTRVNALLADASSVRLPFVVIVRDGVVEKCFARSTMT
ncbi:MAG TPA: hypothetical protein VGB89_06330 [Bacteroidota bacterium]